MAAIPTQDAREFLRFLRAQPREVLTHDDALLPLLVQQVVRRAIEPAFVPAFLDAILLAHCTGDIEAPESLLSGDTTPDQSHLTPQSPSPYPSPSLSPASPPLDPHHLQQQQQHHANGHNHTSHPHLARAAVSKSERELANRYKTVVPREAFFQQFEPKTSSHGLCGYVFQRNDIAFNCKTCQLDETCVLCLQCYRNGNHEGHDIFFHRTFPGGCCDCGDSEAWDPDGFCIYHGDRAETDGDATPGEASDEQPGLPQELLGLADALFEQIVLFMVEMAKKSMDTFDCERVDAHGRELQQAYAAQLQGTGSNPADLPLFHVRMCNDDVHSDEELVLSLTEKRIPDPRELVRRVDSNGYEIVAANVTLRDALTLMQAFKTEGWHVCVVEDQHMHDESVLLHVIRWIKQIGSLSKPLLSMFYGKLFDTSNPMSAPKEPLQVLFLSDPYFRKESVLELYELYLKLQGDKDPKLKFSVVFAKVYNRMMSKYFCGIGTRDESLFQYGVQIFTTPSIVSHLASNGVLDMLLDTFNVALELAKSSKLSAVVAASARFVPSAVARHSRTLDCDHSLLKFRRYTFTTDNIGYVFNIPSVASEILLTKDLLRKWFDALRQVQGLDPQVRIQDGHAHVTFETELWFTAFSFHSTITKLLSQLVKGLRNTDDTDASKQAMIHNVLDCFWEQLDLSGIAGAVLQLHTPPFGYLMGARQEQIVKFDVASQPVSFHYPLHSLLASFLLESLYYGPGSSVSAPSSSPSWLSTWKAFVEDSILRFYSAADDAMDHEATNFEHKRELLIYGLMEYPLRTLVLCAQIHSGLWIRNGQSMHRQMVNYMSPPWCSELRDLDLFLLQISTGIVGFRKFFTIYFDRFGLSEWLVSLKNSRSSLSRDFPTGGDDDKLVTVLEAALLQLIWIVTELPPPLDAMQEHDIVLRREIIHRLTQHPCRLSELLDQTSFMVSTVFGGVASQHKKQHLARVERILDEVADVQVKRSSLMSPFLPGGDGANDGGGVMEPNKYVLKKEFFSEYDPGFYHLSRSGHEKAQFARQEALFKTWKVDDAPIPMVEQLPPGHASLSSIRFMVLERGFIGILRLLLEDATLERNAARKRTNLTVVLRVLHLVNIMVLVLKHSTQRVRASDALLSDSKKRKVLALFRSGADAFDEDDDWRGKKRVRRQAARESESDVQMSSDSDQGDVAEVQDHSVVALLATFARDQVKNDFDTSKSTIAAIYWILKELAAMDRTIDVFVAPIFVSKTKKLDESVDDSGLSKAELKKLHQKRAIEAMMARQKAFAQSSIFADMQEDDDDDDDMAAHGGNGDAVTDGSGQHDSTAGSTVVYRPPPVPDCIICSQKKKDDPIMYIGHSQMSNVTTHALAQADESADGSGDAGAVTEPAFPPQIYLSLCGHAVHLHCWRKYFDSVKAQSRFNLEHSQSNVAFDAHFGEFLCPLCQALSSMVVPYVPLSGELTLDDRERDRASLERVFQSKQDTASILRWLSDELPARLEAIEMEDDDEDFSDDDDECSDSEDETGRTRPREDVRAMKQFALSFLETLLRFQPDVPNVAAAMSALTSGFLNTGPQLAHVIWSAVTSTITSVQLSGISSAIYSLEASAASAHGLNGPPKAPTNAFSSLTITSLLNAPVPCMKTRLAVSLPESLDSQLDPFSPREDSKLNVLLRALRRVHVLCANRKHEFYHALVAPIQSNLRLQLTPEEWENALVGGPPLELGQPILGQDLLYLSVAVCSSMVHTKAEILRTLRSFCVLHMAQVLVQLARVPAEEPNDEDAHLDGVCSGSAATTGDHDEAAMASSGRTTEEDLAMQRALEHLMDRWSALAGVDLVVNAPAAPLTVADDGSSAQPAVVRPHARLRGYQLLYLFKSACAVFMRQVTLLCRAFFRGEHDPDASWCANFVSSLRLSTNFYDLSQQLGVPTIDHVLQDAALLAYLDAAATQLQHTRYAAIPTDVQRTYEQTGHVDALLEALDRVTGADGSAAAVVAGESGDDAAPGALTPRHVVQSNLDRMPALPFRRTLDANGVMRLYVATIRLTRLAALYTDLHCEVLGKSKCKQTWRMVENPALCLACGEVLCAGSECCRRRSDSMGACTYHAITCGRGVGLFFLIRSSSVLLVFGPRSSYFGSPYLDMFGEEDINIRRGRPLYLSTKRMKALQALYANHLLANEVARNRRTSEQYIRSNYY